MAELKLAIRTGSTAATGKVAVFSLTATNPTVTVGTTDYTVGSGLTAVSIGEDGAGGSLDSADTAAVALYSWVTDTISSLSPASQYAISVTQGSDTETGTLRTMPDSSATNVYGAFVTCHDKNSRIDIRGYAGEVGCWKYLRDKAEAEELDFIIHADDHGYVDSYSLGNTAEQPRFSILPFTTTPKEYTLALGYASFFGLIPMDTHQQDPDKIWCFHHLPFLCGNGDHEMMNNPEETTNVTADDLSKSFSVYMKTVGACDLGYVDDSVTSASVNYAGPFEVIMWDRIFGLPVATKVYDTGTQESASIAVDTSANATARLLGAAANQQDKIIAAVDTSSPFKILGMCNDAYLMMSQADRLTAVGASWNTSYLGAQQPMHGYTECADGTSEWTELMLKKSGGSVYSKAISYGAPVVGFHGDLHRPCSYYHYRPESKTHHALNLHVMSAGSVNGRGMFPLHPICEPANYYYKGSTQLWVHPDTSFDKDVLVDGVNSCIVFNATQSNSVWSMDVDIMQVDVSGSVSTPRVLYSETFTGGKSTYSPPFLRQGWV